MDRIIQQLREAMPYGLLPRFMFRDNDRFYGDGVAAFLKACGVEEVRTAYRSPWQKGYASYCTSLVRSDVTSGNRLRSESFWPWLFTGASWAGAM